MNMSETIQTAIKAKIYSAIKEPETVTLTELNDAYRVVAQHDKDIEWRRLDANDLLEKGFDKDDVINYIFSGDMKILTSKWFDPTELCHVQADERAAAVTAVLAKAGA